MLLKKGMVTIVENYVIEMLNITKEFPGIIANDNVTLQLKKGEIHALLGENGAGKSTLMSVLFGLYQPEAGTIKKDGKVIKEIFPYLLTNSNKRIKKIAIKDLLKISKLIIDTYSYCRKKDIVIESFNWIRTTGEKAFDILNTEPSTQFNDKCMEKLHEEDEEINLMLSWSRICNLKEYKFKELTKQDYCSFADINKVVALIPIYRLLNGNKRIKYFVHQE